ncbi:MAG: DMT family transporter [Thermodesulfobacteriota bacterium]
MIGYVCVMTAAVMWASSGVAGKALFAQGITPFELVQVRVTVSTLLLAGFLGWRRRDLLRINRKDLGYFLLLGGGAMALVQVTYFYAISKIQVAAAIFLQYLAPSMVAVFSVMFWRERLTRLKCLSVCLSVAGCYLMVGGYNLGLLEMKWPGILSGLASAVCFAAYTLIGERGMHRYSPWTVLFYAFVFATLTWHIIYPPFQYLFTGYTPAQWTGLLYVSVVGTVIPFGLFFVGVNHIRSTRAAITATLEPVSAGFLAYFFLNETLEPLQVLGGGMVVGAIILLQIHREHDLLTPALIRISDPHLTKKG